MLKNMNFVLFALFCVGISLVLWSSNKQLAVTSVRLREGEDNKPVRLRPSKTLQKPENCYKPSESASYKICENLPYSNISCRMHIAGEDARDGMLVPNIVHYVWFGNRPLLFYHYLSVRSAAANQQPEKIIFHINDVAPQGKWWQKLVEEIPCLETSHLTAPTTIFGQKVKNVMHQTDVARNDLLIKHGGIYVDSDVLFLRSVDPLRRYPFTMGRSIKTQLSNGAMLANPNSTFLRENIEAYRNFEKDSSRDFAYVSCKVPLILSRTRTDLPIHVEETSMQRPNPWVDGSACITHDSFNISDNFLLHIHPSISLRKDPKVLLEYGVEELRVYDSTYGAAARAALFGTQDLVFMKDEGKIARNRKKAKKIPLLGYP